MSEVWTVSESTTPEELRGGALAHMVLQARIPSRTADHASSKACERRGMIWQNGHCFNGRLVDMSVINYKSAFGREKNQKDCVHKLSVVHHEYTTQPCSYLCGKTKPSCHSMLAWEGENVID